jgi:hypothetical protein
MLLRISVLVSFAVGWVASPGLACSVTEMPTPAELLRRAETIVRVRADRFSDQAGQDGTLAGSGTQVRFAVLEVLKGCSVGSTIEFNGRLGERDDPNDHPVPYTFVRPGGRSGNCFALEYRLNGEYLLLLARDSHAAYAQPNRLTPYWAPLTATNEQLFGPDDPWLAWVKKQLAAPQEARGWVSNTGLEPTPLDLSLERRGSVR